MLGNVTKVCVCQHMVSIRCIEGLRFEMACVKYKY